jgi:DNA-binding NarL/FixJ family response regulator
VRVPGEGEDETPLDDRTRRAIRVLICDDHRLVTETLTDVIGRDPDFDLLASANSSIEAVALAADHRPDVVLMDLEFRGSMSGIEATRRIREASPSTKVVIMTAHEDERLLVDAVEAGASGFLRKTEGIEELVGAVKAAAAGEMLIDRAALARLLPRVAREREAHRDARRLMDLLTEREREILALLGQGSSNDEIASALYISPQTVQTHVRNILTKLGVHSKLAAVAFAARHGGIPSR